MMSKSAYARREEDLFLLKSKIHSIILHLKDMKVYSKSCQDAFSGTSISKKMNEDGTDSLKSFSGTVDDLLGLIEECLILILLLCKMKVSSVEWNQILEEFQMDLIEEESEFLKLKRESGTETTFADPSVRFFGIDWKSISQKCSSLESKVEIFTSNLSEQEQKLDCNVVSNILKDLCEIEADVNFHAEAVFQGRLSKSHRTLIQSEQMKYSSIVVEKTTNAENGSQHSIKHFKVPKSHSFCGPSTIRTSVLEKKQRSTFNFMRSKTSKDFRLNLLKSEESPEKDSNGRIIHLSNGNDLDVNLTSTCLSNIQLSKKKVSLLQNLSDVLRNIR